MLATELIPGGEPSRRLMVVLHGLGDSMEGYLWLPHALKLPWMNYLLVNAPDSYFGGYSWYDFAANPGPGIERSRKELFSLLDAQRDAGFASDQTMLFGFSQGCLMTMEVGGRYSHRLAGFVGISGYVHEPDTLLKNLSPVAEQQRFLVTHGTDDPLIPCNMARRQFSNLKSAGLDIRWHEFAKGHTIAGEAELNLIRDFVHSCYPE